MNSFAKMRKKRGYSQESVAAAIGVERSTIAKWETGIAKPRIDNAQDVRVEFLQNLRRPRRAEKGTEPLQPGGDNTLPGAGSGEDRPDHRQDADDGIGEGRTWRSRCIRYTIMSPTR